LGGGDGLGAVVGARVGQRDPDGDPERACALGDRSVQHHLGRPARRGHLDVAKAPHLESERLGHGLLGAETRGQVLAGTGARRRVGSLGVGEEPLGEPGPAVERLLETSDLQQIDPDRR
jgi:hypothetical protein